MRAVAKDAPASRPKPWPCNWRASVWAIALVFIQSRTVVIQSRSHSLIGPALRDAASALIRQNGV